MNGVYIRGFGWFHQRNRADLHVSGLQEALHLVHGRTGDIICLCRYQDGVYLPLEAFKTGDRQYRIDRRRVTDDHASGCIYREPVSRPITGTAPPTSRILDPIREEDRLTPQSGVGDPARAEGTDEAEDEEKLRPATFTGFVRDLFAKSYNQVWVESQRYQWPSRLPLAAEILCRFELLLDVTPLADARNVQEAAERRGFQLVFGIIEGRVPDGDDGGTVVRVHRLDRSQLSTWLCELPPAVLRNAAAQVQVHRGHIEGPYFFTAVCRGATVVKMHLRAIYFDGEFLFTVDSHFERGFGADLLNRGQTFFKPPAPSLVEYEAFPPGMQLVDGAAWLWVPDFLVYGANPGTGTIVEVAGFDDEDYLTRLSRKMTDYELMVRGTSVKAVHYCGSAYAHLKRQDAPAVTYAPFTGAPLPSFKRV